MTLSTGTYDIDDDCDGLANEDDKDDCTSSTGPDCANNCGPDMCSADCLMQVTLGDLVMTADPTDGAVSVSFFVEAWRHTEVWYYAGFDHAVMRSRLDVCKDGDDCELETLPITNTSDNNENYSIRSRSITLDVTAQTLFTAVLIRYPTVSGQEFDEHVHEFTMDLCADVPCDPVPCPDDGCYNTPDWHDYPDTVPQQCQNGDCVPDACTPTIILDHPDCTSTAQTCSEQDGTICTGTQACFSATGTPMGYIAATEGYCCLGVCQEACWNDDICVGDEACMDSQDFPVTEISVMTPDGIVMCCPAECNAIPTLCSEHYSDLFQDCDEQCWTSDGLDASTNVNLYGTPTLCCPINAICANTSPNTGFTCEDGSFSSCQDGEFCYNTITNIIEYEIYQGLQCCDTGDGSHECKEPPSTSCPDPCPVGSNKCESSTQYKCEYVATSGCYEWIQGEFCANGCEGYYCNIPATIPICVDDDGGVVSLEPGTVTLDGQFAGEDSCIDSTTLTEWFCKEGQAMNENIQCEYSCSEGRCVPDQNLPTRAKIAYVTESLPNSFQLNEGDTFNLAEDFKESYETVAFPGFTLPAMVGFSLDDLGASWTPDYLTVTDTEWIKVDMLAIVTYRGEEFRKSIEFEVWNTNEMPTIMGLDLVRHTEGRPWLYELQYNDRDLADIHTFIFTSELLALDSVSVEDQYIRWNDPKPGNYTITLTVNDGHDSVTKTIILNVLPQSVIDDLSNDNKDGVLKDVFDVTNPNEVVQEEISESDVTDVFELVIGRAVAEERENQNIDQMTEEEREAFERLKKIQTEAFITSSLEKQKQTSEFITIRKSFVIMRRENKTIITIRIQPKRVMKNVTIYESIPKSVARSVTELEFTIQPIIIEADPLIMWHFEELESEQELSYVVKGTVEEVETQTITIAEEITLEEIKKPKSLLKLFIPLLMIPIISIVLIYFSHFKMKRKPQVPIYLGSSQNP